MSIEKCQSEFHVANKHGDEPAIFECWLPQGHFGPHEYKEEHDVEGVVKINWDKSSEFTPWYPKQDGN